MFWIFSPFTGILISSVFFSSVRWCVCVAWKRLEIEAVNDLFSTTMFIVQSCGVHAFSQNLLLGFSDWLFMSELWRWDCFELLGMFVLCTTWKLLSLLDHHESSLHILLTWPFHITLKIIHCFMRHWKILVFRYSPILNCFNCLVLTFMLILLYKGYNCYL